MVNPRGGTFTPSPAQQTIVTGISHSPHGSHHSAFSAGASPSTDSPTGTNSVTRIAVAQVYLLLSTIKEDKDRTKWEQQAEQIRKLIDENGMEVFQKYFSRLVVANASHIFSLNRQPSNGPLANYQILVSEIAKISHDVDQAGKIAESIETANEDLFRDFDLSTFMEHFKLDALEKTILALAFKTGSRSDLKTKADAILSANYQKFLECLCDQTHANLTPNFLATIIDRFIQEHPPNFDDNAKRELVLAVNWRSKQLSPDPPATEVLAALFLLVCLRNQNTLALGIKAIGSAVTAEEETCRNYLRKVGNIRLDEEQVAAALLYTAISRTPTFSPGILVNSLRKEVSRDFNWRHVIAHFDQEDLVVSREHFLALYEALKPLAVDDKLDIQQMWGGIWRNSEAQLSFISAFASLRPNQLDATTIPGFIPSFTVEDFANSTPAVIERAASCARHTLVSVVALTAMFQVALQSNSASDSVEAKRLFQEVVVPNLDMFLVAAFGVPKPWPDLANETVNNLFDRFLFKIDPNYDFVLEGLWRKDKIWVVQNLVDAHAKAPLELPTILDHAVRHDWLTELMTMLNGFGLDLAALAHARGFLDLERWAEINSGRPQDLTQALLTFLNIKAKHELEGQRSQTSPDQLYSVMLPVKTISAMLNILESLLPRKPLQELIMVQRACITAYPRLINYGEGYDDIIDANGQDRNSLPQEANSKMEEHYKRMYSEDLQVRNVVEALDKYKHSRDPSDQDVFACMIHGLFDEYNLYGTYPLEALATTAVLFGGIISHKLIDSIPLEIGLGMILEAVRDHSPEESMYKFGLQALMQLFSRLREWPAFCKQLLQIPGLHGTEAWNKAEEVVREEQEDLAHHGLGSMAHGDITNGGSIANGIDDMLAAEPTAVPFTSLNVEQSPYSNIYENPSEDTQEKVLFVLNNITERNLESKFKELKDVIDDRYQQWFAGHLVEERAKMQPNYHELYLDLVKHFGNKALWVEVLRETYVSVIRMLNAESTMQSSVERTHLKNLGGWLGSLTLARDKPIKHRNIAFKQLLVEAFDSQRLIVVIPFVCKVLIQGEHSTVFKPPNPWLMDIIHLLIELYHHAELKLNLKFEIEVLCKGLNLDHKSIEPSNDIMTRVPPVEEVTEPMTSEALDRFDNLSLNGMGGAAASGRFSPQDITSSIPDLGPLLVYPPPNDVVNQARLQEIMRSAITRAVHEIISPVVERSVTIAAISTAQMIHKDFATEPNEQRVRAAAINMVKKTAGSLALVTSKEPLRASMTNYIRAMSVELPQGLPEGTVVMAVNANLDLACSQVEKKAEERAVPEIEDMIEMELQARRQHRMNRPSDEPYIDPALSRWAWTIPNPYKLQPSLGGLNQEQMAIYDEFARQPRAAPSLSGTTHVASSSTDATRSIANDLLQDPYPAVPNLPTPAEPPAMPHLNNQQMAYPQSNASIPNGRMQPIPMDARSLADRVQKLLGDLQRAVAEVPEQHFVDLPRPNPIHEILDALYNLVIRTVQTSDDFSMYTAEQICMLLFNGVDSNLLIESLVHSLQNICRLQGRTPARVALFINNSEEGLMSVPLIMALVKADMLDWQHVDITTSRALTQRKEGSMEFLTSLLSNTLLVDRPLALYSHFSRSMEVAWQWTLEEPAMEAGKALRSKLTNLSRPTNVNQTDDRIVRHHDQMEYCFDEWVALCNNPYASQKVMWRFVTDLYVKQTINNRDELLVFLRLCIDASVDRFDEYQRSDSFSLADAYSTTDALAKLILMLVLSPEDESQVKGNKAAFFDLILSLVIMVLNHHYITRGEHFNQKIFSRLISTLLAEFSNFVPDLTPAEHKDMALSFARNLWTVRPSFCPSFLFAWMALIAHRDFLPVMMQLPNNAGWEPYCNLLESLMAYIGELLKPLHIAGATKDVYRAAMKLLVVLQHDYPEFLAANHSKLCAQIPTHCVQLHNLILSANPAPPGQMPDPLQPGLKVDRIDEIRDSPDSAHDVEAPLRQAGLLEVLEQALQSGPSEDAVAHIAHAIQHTKNSQTAYGFIPIMVDLKLIDSIVVYVGMFSIARSGSKGGPIYTQGSPDAALFSMLAHELHPDARYHFLSSIVNQLRFPNAHTHYFSQALLEIFGHDQSEQEDLDIGQQITRVLFERMIGQWPQPWGLVLTIVELVKNQKYMFFELPFIKSASEVADRFAALAQRV
ncbi:CCR4-NOT transcription complex subunit [Phlyctema vagabunda]|uniref:CCR4-NOT transcription complex subunit n=1 Tax=Phlyctema vagabunda TaxID=108571 RepID=A0ABR4PBV1_9HELO